MKNGNQDFLGTDTDGYEDIQLMRLIPLPDWCREDGLRL